MASRHDRTRRLAAARRQRVQHSITPRGHRSSHAVLQREDALDCTSPASRRQAGSAKESYELLESETILISLRCTHADGARRRHWHESKRICCFDVASFLPLACT